MRPRQHFGRKQPTVASKRAAAQSLLVIARELPTIETLVRSYGLRPAEAEQMLTDARLKREARS